MAKATKAGGNSFTEDEINDPHPPYVIQRAVLGGELKLAGTDSSGLSDDETKSSERQNLGPQLPAQTTENPSDPTDAKQEGSSAHSTGGGGQKTTQPPFARRAPRKKASTRVVPDEDDDFD